MRRFSLILEVLFISALLFSGCGNHQDGPNNWDAVVLPIVSGEDQEEEITAAFYENGFDFDYESLPLLTLPEENNVIQIALQDNFNNTVQLWEEYYTYTSDGADCDKQTYDLTKDQNGMVSLIVPRRGSSGEDRAFYFLENQQGTFAFGVLLPLNPER